MTAIELVKKFGIGYAIKILNYDPSISSDVCHLDFGETEKLKQIVEAWELVERLGGFESAIKERDFRRTKNILQSYDKELSDAISLLEQCQ